jgi:hypothetical protein
VALLPSGLAFFQTGVVEFAAAPQDVLQRPFLLGGWQQFVLEGLAYRSFYIESFCPMGVTTESN